MEIHLYTICWNDAHMLPFFFRHYDRFVSRYFFFDDDSDDGSVEWLRARPDVEVQPFVRSDPASFCISEQLLSNQCWKRSRGSADWVIVTDVDEHLFHDDLVGLLRRYIASGITFVPAPGFQMVSNEFPDREEMLCYSRTSGALSSIYSKVSLFNPSAIAEINYGIGRHRAAPTGRIVAPAKDELRLLHYKYLSLDWAYARQQQLRQSLGPKDVENAWGYQYSYSEAEFRAVWRLLAENLVDVRTYNLASYPGACWWEPYRLQSNEVKFLEQYRLLDHQLAMPLQRRQHREDYRPRVREDVARAYGGARMLLLSEARRQVASFETALQQLQRERDALEQAVTGLKEETHTLHARTAGLEQERAALRGAIRDLQQEHRNLESSALANAEQLRRIEESTLWRATAGLRWFGARLPPPIRRAVGRTLCWALTPHLLPRRFKFLRQRQTRRNAARLSCRSGKCVGSLPRLSRRLIDLGPCTSRRAALRNSR